jgi:hypothetical protein
MECTDLAENGLFFSHKLDDSGPFGQTDHGEIIAPPEVLNFIGKFILEYFPKACNGFTPADAVRCDRQENSHLCVGTSIAGFHHSGHISLALFCSFSFLSSE